MDKSILMKLIYHVDVDKIIQLTKGQGHGVKGQGQIGSFVTKIDSSIKHEWMIRS